MVKTLSQNFLLRLRLRRLALGNLTNNTCASQSSPAVLKRCNCGKVSAANLCPLRSTLACLRSNTCGDIQMHVYMIFVLSSIAPGFWILEIRLVTCLFGSRTLQILDIG